MIPNPPPIPPRPRHRILSRIGYGLLGFCLLAGLIRLTVKDSQPSLALFYYMTPGILLAPLAAIAEIIFLLTGRARAAAASFILFLACLIGWHFEAWQPGPAAVSETVDVNSRHRLLLWNVMGATVDSPPILDQITRYRPDVVGLVEVRVPEPAVRAFAKAMPEYQLLPLGAGMAVAVKREAGSAAGPESGILGRRRFDLRPGGWCAMVDLLLRGKLVTVVMVDLKSDPLRWRRPAIERLMGWLESEEERPMIVMGDFNTPADSPLLAPLRVNHVNAFERAGRGYYVTWPNPLPILSLDQVWMNRGVTPISASLTGHSASDHRIFTVDFTFWH